MAGIDRLLIDTSALYAIRSASDLFHARASSSYRRFVDVNVDFWTTSYVLVETVAHPNSRKGFEAVDDFSRWCHDSDVQMVWVSGRMNAAAWERYVWLNEDGAHHIMVAPPLMPTCCGLLVANPFCVSATVAHPTRCLHSAPHPVSSRLRRHRLKRFSEWTRKPHD